MNLLTIIGALVLGVGLISNGLSDSRYNSRVRESALKKREENEPPIYFNARGKMIYAPTGEECYIWYDQLISLRTEKVLFDYKKVRDKEETKILNEIIQKYDFNYYTLERGIYYEIETGKKYQSEGIISRPPRKDEVHWKMWIVDFYTIDTNEYVKSVEDFRCCDLTNKAERMDYIQEFKRTGEINRFKTKYGERKN